MPNHMLTVLVVRRGRHVVARCLEYDVVAQGDTINEAIQAWEDTLVAQVLVDLRAGREPLRWIGPAPEECRALYEESIDFDAVPRTIDIADYALETCAPAQRPAYPMQAEVRAHLG